MDIVKYFYEEPVHLEALSAEADPDARRRAAPEHDLAALLRPTSYYRAYLAGTDLAADRTGLTAIANPDAFVAPLLDVFAGKVWTQADRSGAVTVIEDAAPVWRDPAETAVLVAAAGPVDAAALAAVASVERRYGIPSLKRLLAEADAVCFPEPAHDGWDWSLFAAAPLRKRLIDAFRRHPVADVRCFALPYREARSEHKFYFERWQLDTLPAHIEEL
ncbi:MAG: hypothetical protein ABJF88_17040 [Rhodothermales bacterium]